MISQTDVSLLIDEYQTLIEETGGIPSAGLSNKQRERLVKALEISGEWTHQAACELVNLATKYGSFMLRNACSLSLALDIEEGEAGF